MKKWTVRDLEYFDKPLHCYAKDFEDFLAKNSYELFDNKEDCDNYIKQNEIQCCKVIEIIIEYVLYGDVNDQSIFE